jgi:hypothetical protein
MSQSGVAEDMSSSIAQKRRTLYNRLLDLIVQACEADDVDLISQAISLSSSPSSTRSPEQVVQMTFPRVFSRNAPKVLDYILTHGVDFKDRAALYIALAAYECEFPKTLVQVLLSHGWDINHRNLDQPLLWQIVNDGDAVAWCLEHGASVLPKGQKLWPNLDINSAEEFAEYFNRFPYSSEERSDCLYYCPPILELAASQSTIATFELLRSKGAPLGWRVLHKAASTRASMAPLNNSIRGQTSPATMASNKGKQLQLLDRQLAHTHQERMAMVQHLVDTLKLDVNARDQPPGWRLGNFYGRPLHYVAHNSGIKGDCREVTLFLLGRGADPDLSDTDGGTTPIVLGKGNFLDAVHAWRLMKTDEAGQSNDEADRDYVGQEGA